MYSRCTNPLTLLFAAFLMLAGCRTWDVPEADVDPHFASEIDFLRRSKPTNTPKKSAIEDRDMKLSPPAQLADGFQPGLEIPNTQGNPNEEPNEKIIVLAPQEPDRRRNPSLAPRPQRPILPPPVENNSASPKATALQPNPKVQEPSPDIPPIAKLKPRHMAKSNTPVQADTSTSISEGTPWISEPANDFEQPGIEWRHQEQISSVPKPHGNFLSPRRITKALNHRETSPEELPRGRESSQRYRSEGAIQQVTHLEADEDPQREEATTKASKNSSAEQADQKSEATPSNQSGDDRDLRTPAATGNRDSKPPLSSAKPDRAPHVPAPPLDIGKTIETLVCELDQQLNASNFDNLPPQKQDQIRFRHQLLTLLKKRDQIEDLKDPSSKLLSEVLPLIANQSADNRELAKTMEQLQAELSANQPKSLNLPRAAFCTRIDGFGQITQFSATTFHPQQRMLVYCEVENFESVVAEDKMHVTVLSGTYRILDAAGKVCQQRTFPDIVDKAITQRRDFYIHLPVMLDHLAAGNYQLQVVIEDKASGATAQLKTPLKFSVVTDRTAKR